MKKLIIALGAVAMAVGAQAASMKWQAVVFSGAVDASYAGWNVYLCESLADGGFKSESEISGYLYGTEANTKTTAASGRDENTKYMASATAGGIDVGDIGMQTVYAVVVSPDGKGYWTASAQGEVYDTNPSPVKADFQMQSIVAGNYTPWAGTPGPDPVPEPTSGLLLLLGVAGLALRRKQK